MKKENANNVKEAREEEMNNLLTPERLKDSALRLQSLREALERRRKKLTRKPE